MRETDTGEKTESYLLNEADFHHLVTSNGHCYCLIHNKRN